jgi:hypothetical protein
MVVVFLVRVLHLCDCILFLYKKIIRSGKVGAGHQSEPNDVCYCRGHVMLSMNLILCVETKKNNFSTQ